MQVYSDIFLSVLDVALATLVIYWFLKIIVQNEKMIFVINTILMVTFIYFISNILHLNVLSKLLENIYSWGIILIFIIFQTEIRAFLEKMGDINQIKKKDDMSEDFIEDFTKTVFQMANDKIGALITFEQLIPLSNYTSKAVKLDAQYSSHLLFSIFNKESPLHDGAVVMKNETIMYASTYYPIELDINIDKKYGTRHRAAISISRETDAVTVVCSEERGTVSIAYKENLYTDLEYDFVVEYLRSKLKNDMEK